MPTQIADSNYSSACSIQGNFGAVVEASCDEGYLGIGRAVCQSNGYFSTVPCEPKSCGHPSRQLGYVISSGGTDFNEARTTQCATAYTGTAADIVCQSDGSWSQATGCSLVSPQCNGQHVTVTVSSEGIGSCDGTCVDTSSGSVCYCSDGFTVSPQDEGSCV